MKWVVLHLEVII
jgi:hypothetical protein